MKPNRARPRAPLEGGGTEKRLKYRWLDALLSEAGPRPTVRFALLALATHMEEDGGRAFPSTRLLARETGLSRRTVEEALREAEAAGWIRRHARGSSGQGWRRLGYRPSVPDVEQEPPHVAEGGAGDSPPHPEGGAGDSPPRPEPAEGGAVGARRGAIDARRGETGARRGAGASPEVLQRGSQRGSQREAAHELRKEGEEGQPPPGWLCPPDLQSTEGLFRALDEPTRIALYGRLGGPEGVPLPVARHLDALKPSELRRLRYDVARQREAAA